VQAAPFLAIFFTIILYTSRGCGCGRLDCGGGGDELAGAAIFGELVPQGAHTLIGAFTIHTFKAFLTVMATSFTTLINI
jgi:hypothetical protein